MTVCITFVESKIKDQLIYILYVNINKKYRPPLSMRQLYEKKHVYFRINISRLYSVEVTS